uniref:Uncharacterized protein n=1 Tax=Rhizophora mucronata TaxID=61149 RepID=A0A2P2N7W5_RHIMU
MHHKTETLNLYMQVNSFC